MQMQREVFILTGPDISSKDAETFFEQAQRLPHLKINECMTRQAIEIVHVKIMTESGSSPVLPRERKELWQNFLDIESVAKYVLQFFSPNKRGNKTLAENFAQIPFHYSLSSDEDELATYLAYKELLANYTLAKGELQKEQHLELISILEKRLPRGSRIQNDYNHSKVNDVSAAVTWEMAMLRIIAVVSAARESIRMSASYGDPTQVYSYPSTAVPPSKSRKRMAEREAQPTFSGKSTLAVRDVEEVPLMVATTTKVCRSCGDSSHTLRQCPSMYYTDTNNDHNVEWVDSKLGKTWADNGEVKWQEHLILPGYENRRMFHPKGSEPFLMVADNKKQKPNQGF
jgi:hypothetical protein